ncbi:hypothetical protein WN943_023671 [Citrus x changshan-huyou]
MNEALLMNIGWSMAVSPQSLWVQVLSTKYGLNTTNLQPTLNIRTGSYLWKAIGNIWKHVLDGILWAIGNGKQYVAELVTPDGTWEWHSFEHFLPNNLLLLIAAIKPPSVISGDDQIFWAT